MSSENTCEELDMIIDKNMRLKLYGGTQELPTSWWPPTVPQDLESFSIRENSFHSHRVTLLAADESVGPPNLSAM